MSEDAGGDPACWAHVFDEPVGDRMGRVAVVRDVGAADATGRSGVVWSLPHGGDLDGNLVHLAPGGEVGAHVNDEVDVLVYVVSGGGELAVDGAIHALSAGTLALVPRGAARTLRAGDRGIAYLSVHRRRGPLGISARPEAGRER